MARLFGKRFAETFQSFRAYPLPPAPGQLVNLYAWRMPPHVALVQYIEYRAKIVTLF